MSARRSHPVGVCLTVALAIGLMSASQRPDAQSRPWFDDVTDAVGLAFTHANGATGEFHLPEIMGAGVALVDVDGDGDLDVLLVQSGRTGPQSDDTPAAASNGTPEGAQLWRNDLRVEADGTRRLSFTNVTAGASLPKRGYGMGVAAADYDGDGRVDLYITAVGSNVLLRNVGEGRFEDVTARAGVDDPRWSTSAAWADVDGDGHLDLYVANYVDFTWAANKPCTEPAGARDYCAPSTYKPVPDRLFHNRGDGTFEDVSAAAGITRAYGAGLGVAVRDYDRDGHLDIYVANDATPNQLWRNQGDGTFEDDGLLSGTAFNAAGRPEGSMGIAAADPDGDGDEDLVVTNLVGETFVLYENDGTGGFEDRRVAAGLSQPTAMMTGFGADWTDADNDGVQDLLVVNGAVNLVSSLRGHDNPFRQRNQIFRGIGGGAAARGPAGSAAFRLEELVGVEAGPAFALLEVTRGLAIGDLDNDGFPDAVITNNGGPARVLRNTASSGHAWIGVELRQPGPNRQALGATVTVEAGPSAGRLFRVHTDGSYLSAADPRIRIGLGAHRAAVTVKVTWPDGSEQRVEGLMPGRYHEIVKTAPSVSKP